MLVVQALVTLVLFTQDNKSNEEMFAIGEKALANAKDLYGRKEFFDCIAEAERARNIFQALVELYDSQNKKSDRQRCEELVKQCNQLIKLANDGRKGTASPKDPPPPPAIHKPDEPQKDAPAKAVEAPKPEPKKEPEVDPALIPAAVSDFSRVLSGVIDTADAVKMAPLLRDLNQLAKKPGPWQAYGKVAWTIVTRIIDGSWPIAPEDRPVYKDYSDKYLNSKVDHRQAALFLIKCAETIEKDLLRWRPMRLLALVHVRESIQAPESPLHLELLTKGKTLDLAQDEKERWITREGESIAACKTPESFKTAAKVRDPIRDVFKALSLFEHIGANEAKEWIVECKNACAAPEPSAAKILGGIKSILDSKKICHACDGTHQKACPMKCEDGMRVSACNRCGGLGYGVFRGRKLDCLAEPPPGKSWEKGSHKVKDPCHKCGAKGKVDCHLCPSAWSGAALKEGIKTDPCDCCEGKGWLLPDMKLPCYLCFATGKRYSGFAMSNRR
jgi:hypothetical protein